MNKSLTIQNTVTDNSSIIETNNDACQCKIYAIERGYWSDPYLKALLGSCHSERRTPEISLGYYVRVHGVRKLIENFLRLTNGDCQILNIGSGFDTTVFYLLDRKDLSFKHFVDIDFNELTEIKSMKIRRLPIFRKILPEEEKNSKIPSGFHSSVYTILPCDLRDLNQLEQQLKILFDRKVLDEKRATLFLSECVLIYMSDERSLELLKFLSSKFTGSCLSVNFEQINMNDRFGQIMFDNLKQRSCYLVGMNSCQSKNAQIKRYLDANFSSAQCLTLNEFYRDHLSNSEKQRIESIDGGLDEKELLEQLFEHYCFSWASRDDANLALKSIGFE